MSPAPDDAKKPLSRREIIRLMKRFDKMSPFDRMIVRNAGDLWQFATELVESGRETVDSLARKGTLPLTPKLRRRGRIASNLQAPPKMPEGV